MLTTDLKSLIVSAPLPPAPARVVAAMPTLRSLCFRLIRHTEPLTHTPLPSVKQLSLLDPRTRLTSKLGLTLSPRDRTNIPTRPADTSSALHHSPALAEAFPALEHFATWGPLDGRTAASLPASVQQLTCPATSDLRALKARWFGRHAYGRGRAGSAGLQRVVLLVEHGQDLGPARRSARVARFVNSAAEAGCCLVLEYVLRSNCMR